MKKGRKICSTDSFNYACETCEMFEECKENNKLYTCDDPIFCFEEFTEYLSEIIDKNNVFCFRVTVNNFGWRSISGSKEVLIGNSKENYGLELLREILPNTDCKYNIWKHGKGFILQNFHHDSPCGNEMYYIRPMSTEVYYKNKGY